MNERTVSLRGPRQQQPRTVQLDPPAGFEIEVPPHLAQAFGLTIFPPPSARVIRCSRPAPLLRRAA